MRRQLIDYSSTRSLDGTSSLSSEKNIFVHEATIYRLPWYSILGWGKFPIFQEESFRPRGDNLSTTVILDFWMGPAPFLVHEKTYSTTAVLDFRMGPAPFSRPRDDLFDYCGTRFPDGTSSFSRP
jgi:hypothetical protein